MYKYKNKNYNIYLSNSLRIYKFFFFRDFFYYYLLDSVLFRYWFRSLGIVFLFI